MPKSIGRSKPRGQVYSAGFTASEQSCFKRHECTIDEREVIERMKSRPTATSKCSQSRGPIKPANLSRLTFITAQVTGRSSNGDLTDSTNLKGLPGTQKREYPYRKGLSGIRRERPGPRVMGSIPVGAIKHICYKRFSRNFSNGFLPKHLSLRATRSTSRRVAIRHREERG